MYVLNVELSEGSTSDYARLFDYLEYHDFLGEFNGKTLPRGMFIFPNVEHSIDFVELYGKLAAENTGRTSRIVVFEVTDFRGL